MSQFASPRDLRFQLFEALDTDATLRAPYHAIYDRDSVETLIDSAMRIAQEHFEPLAAVMDREEPHFDGERVTMPAGLREALRAHAEAGLVAAPFDEALGGAQLPYAVHSAIGAIFAGANMSAAAYATLNTAAANLLMTYGSASQQERYARPLLEGRFFGTMCLSEPQAGSSLADITTRALRGDDGRYRIRGSKMWISGGEHELSENIVHLVLARVEGAPAGTRGISLFVVPRYQLDSDGNNGADNGVKLIGLNHKMGNRGTVNTVLNFGDEHECIGELIGEEQRGLSYMFQMMNEARLAVGIGACGLGIAGYRASVAYARERLQGRTLNAPATSEPIPIIRHADVRRMLLQQRVCAEGSLSLCLYAASLVDASRLAANEEERATHEARLALLTPLAKAWSSEVCTRANDLAIQVHGGYGYTRDYPVERHYRDNRINPIHEGTNGIQALDLLGRKVLRDGGRTISLLLVDMSADCKEASQLDGLEGIAERQLEAVGTLEQTLRSVGARAAEGQLDDVMAHASSFQSLFGVVVLGWLWLRAAHAAARALPGCPEGSDEASFYTGKLAAARFYSTHELPAVGGLSRIVTEADPLLNELDEAGFV